jgi:hypothetical protein
VVKPTDTSLHQAYTFWIKATDTGGAFSSFGPYTVNVGCFPGVVTFADSASFVSAVTLTVGDPNIFLNGV